MNLNKGISLSSLSSINPKQILAVVAKYRLLITIIVITGLVGYTGFQISRIFAIQPDQAYVASQKEKAKATSLRVNKKTIQELQALQSAGDTSISVTPGKNDPFSIND